MEIPYILRAAITMMAMYIAYKAFMSRDSSHSANRAAILASAAASMIIPLLKIPAAINCGHAAAGAIQIGVISAIAEAGQGESSPIGSCWPYLAAAGSALFFMKFAISVASIARKAARGEKVALDGGAILVISDSLKSPVSWLRYIFMSRSDYALGPSGIVAHEMAHVRMRHSVDLIFMDLVCCAQWFNPAAWLLRRELRAVHEYQADKAVLDSGYSAKEYQILLIRKAAGRNWNSVASSLNHSNLKKRITMMKNQKKPAMPALKALLPLAAGAVCALMIAGSASASPKGTAASQASDLEIPYCSHDAGSARLDTVPPEYPGGDAALRMFLATNIRYPDAAKEDGASGTAYIRVNIDEYGKVSGTEILKSSGHESLDSEAIRCTGTLADFVPATHDGKPVACSVALPITFRVKTASDPSGAFK